MKKYSLILSIFGILLVSAFVGFFAVTYFESDLEKGSKLYTDQIIIQRIIGTWNASELTAQATPELQAILSKPEEGSKFKSYPEKLGKLNKCKGLKGRVVEYIDIERGKTVYADYNAECSFEKGDAGVAIKVAIRDDQWKLSSLEISPKNLRPATAVGQKAAPANPAPEKVVKKEEQKPAEKPKEVVSRPKPEQKGTKPIGQPKAKEVQAPPVVKDAPQKGINPKAQAKPGDKALAVAPAAASPSITTYEYNVKDKRDPFVPLIVKNDPVKKKGLTPLENYELGELKLIAILWSKEGGYYAVITLPDSKSYTLKEGMRLGLHEGKVTKITKEAVLIKEFYRDYKGVLSPKDTLLKLRREEEG